MCSGSSSLWFRGEQKHKQMCSERCVIGGDFVGGRLELDQRRYRYTRLHRFDGRRRLRVRRLLRTSRTDVADPLADPVGVGAAHGATGRAPKNAGGARAVARFALLLHVQEGARRTRETLAGLRLVAGQTVAVDRTLDGAGRSVCVDRADLVDGVGCLALPDGTAGAGVGVAFVVAGLAAETVGRGGSADLAAGSTDHCAGVASEIGWNGYILIMAFAGTDIAQRTKLGGCKEEASLASHAFSRVGCHNTGETCCITASWSIFDGATALF